MARHRCPTRGSRARRVAWAHSPALPPLPARRGRSRSPLPQSSAEIIWCATCGAARPARRKRNPSQLQQILAGNEIALSRRSFGARRTGSNSGNRKCPARNPPMCACQATASSLPGSRPPQCRTTSSEPNQDPDETRLHRELRNTAAAAGGNEVAFGIVMAPAVERTPGLKRKSVNRSCHKARHRGGCAHHSEGCAPVGE